MKKIFLFILIGVSVLELRAQKMRLNDASTYLKRMYIDKAKEAIDDAYANEETKDKSKTSYLRAKIYFEIATNPKFKSLDSNAKYITLYSAMNAMKLTEKDKDLDDDNMMYCMGLIQSFYNNSAVKEYQLQNFKNAARLFSMIINIDSKINNVDSLLFDCYYYGGISLLSVDRNPSLKTTKTDSALAKSYFQKLYEIKLKKPLVYSVLSNLQIADKDTVAALKTIQVGKSILGSTLDMVVAEANIYLMKKQSKEAQDLLKIALEKDPTNFIIWQTIGNIYLNQLDKINYDKDSVNYKNYYNEAEKCFVKAIELKADYSDALYNYGTLLLNEGVRIINIADKLKLGDKKYDVLKAKSEVLWKESILKFEKYFDLNPSDRSIVPILKQLYTKTNQLEKIKALNEKAATAPKK